MLSTTLVLLLGIFLTFPSNVRNERYFIVSSQDRCHNDSLESPSLTLSSFATNVSNYIQFNTELLLLPGNHTLHSKLTIKHINQLWLYSNTSDSNNIIFCIDHTARFEFTNITHIHISNVKFLGCGGNRAESVMNFTLINTIFDGQQKKTALMLVKSIVKTENSSFTSNIGGAVIAEQSTATILNCTFYENHANYSTGGAINGHNCSNISVAYSTFYLNSAEDDCGGAVRMLNSTLIISNSTFSQNSATSSHGGALCLQEGTNDLSDCTFDFNEAATFGGAIYARNSYHTYLLRCSFNTNIVTLPTGGGRSMRAYRESDLKITHSSFIDHGSLLYSDGNKTLHNHTSKCQESNAGYRVSGVGLIMTSSTVVFNSTELVGACESIYAYKCNINFTGNSSFREINNEQSKAPSALYIIQSTVSIDGNCNFRRNVAVSGGAIHAAESRIDVNGELVVTDNRALENGGGIYLYHSDFNCRIGSAVEIIDNIARTEGGGIHAIGSSIKVTYVRDCYPRCPLS